MWCRIPPKPRCGPPDTESRARPLELPWRTATESPRIDLIQQELASAGLRSPTGDFARLRLAARPSALRSLRGGRLSSRPPRSLRGRDHPTSRPASEARSEPQASEVHQGLPARSEAQPSEVSSDLPPSPRRGVRRRCRRRVRGRSSSRPRRRDPSRLARERSERPSGPRPATGHT